MIVFQITASLFGAALYLLLLVGSMHLAFRSPLDPDCRFVGIFMLLILVGAPMTLVGGLQ